MDLKEARQEIDRIDRDLTALLEQRMVAVLAVAEYKNNNNMNVYDKTREVKVIESALSYLHNKKLSSYIEKIFITVMEVSKAYQKEHMGQHIFLIGMPGSGKTTIGKLVSNALAIDFYDLDEYIEKKSGKSIQNIMINEGEAIFRNYEKESLMELALLKPAVIATGGGTVLSKDSCSIMGGTGKVFFIQREIKQILGDLDLEVRPLVKESIEYIFRLYKERDPLYEAVCDVKIENKADMESVVQEIVRIVNQTAV